MINIPPVFEQMASQMLIQKFGTKENAIRALRQEAGNNIVLNNAVDTLEKGDYNGLCNIYTNASQGKNINPLSLLTNIFRG